MVRTGMRRDQRDRLRARLVRSAHSRGDPAQPDVHLPETRGHQRECLCIRVEQERDLVRGQSRTGRGAGGDGVSSSSRDGGGDQGLRGEKEKKKKREGRGDEKRKKAREKGGKLTENHNNKKNLKQIDRAVTSALAEGYTTLREPATLSNNNGKPFNATLQKAIGKVSWVF